MFDAHETERKAALRDMATHAGSIDERRAQAIALMGTKYLLHPDNRVQRLDVKYGERSRGTK